MLRKICMTVCGLVLVTVLVGCENKLTRDNYDLIKQGVSTKTEVECTLGKPEADHGDFWEYEDEGKHLSVYVHWNADGKVERKEWIDGRTGEWDGAAPGIDEEPEGRKVSDQKSNLTIDKDD